MDRRDAMKAMLGLPGVVAVSQLKQQKVTPEDVIAFECDERPSQAELEKWKALLDEAFPGTRAIVACAGVRLRIIRA